MYSGWLYGQRAIALCILGPPLLHMLSLNAAFPFIYTLALKPAAEEVC